jgi:transposase
MSTKLHFRPYNPKQILLFSERLDNDIEENNPVRVIDIVIDELKLDNFKKLYKEIGRCVYDAQSYNLRLHEQPLF